MSRKTNTKKQQQTNTLYMIKLETKSSECMRQRRKPIKRRIAYGSSFLGVFWILNWLPCSISTHYHLIHIKWYTFFTGVTLISKTRSHSTKETHTCVESYTDNFEGLPVACPHLAFSWQDSREQMSWIARRKRRNSAQSASVVS